MFDQGPLGLRLADLRAGGFELGLSARQVQAGGNAAIAAPGDQVQGLGVSRFGLAQQRRLAV